MMEELGSRRGEREGLGKAMVKKRGKNPPQVLREVADGTGDVFVFMEGEGYDGLLSLVSRFRFHQPSFAASELHWIKVIRRDGSTDG